MAIMSASQTKEEKGAALVMETNSSSIVSKRSVERLYHPQPHSLRYFVNKPQRRSPLINRGYWIRMYAIEHAVCEFLSETSERPKLVVNFGCGFDPLPFQLLSRKPTLCGNARFVDIDHEKLMLTKRNIIHQNKELNDIVPITDSPLENDAIIIRNDHYLGIGCDLKDLRKLEEALNRESDLSKYSIFCTAEVSLTYMDVKSADALIQWASKLSNDVQFRLLEQYFPDGPKHPFAATMMKHFDKLQAPLYSIHEYPTLEDQETRFTDAGWTYSEAKSLWSLWSDPTFLTPSQRRKLDEVEPFDEWEEFALFASHYFLLSASTREKDENSTEITSQVNELSQSPCGFQTPSLNISHQFPTRSNSERRFGAIIPISFGAFGVNGGYGREARLASTDIFYQPDSMPADRSLTPPMDMGPRMCHSSSALNKGDCLVAGGRTSPRVATSDCWLRTAGSWQLTNSLPCPRFRHCATAVAVEGDESVLIFGGKTGAGEVLGQWLLWNRATGWEEIQVVGEAPAPRFGASMTCFDGSSGVLLGGMTWDGVILEDFWTWGLTRTGNGTISINLFEHTEKMRALNKFHKWLSRFGASTNLTSWGLIIVGGVSLFGCIPQEYEMMLLDSNNLLSYMKKDCFPDHPILGVIKKEIKTENPRPLLIGHVSWAACPGEVLIVGGGGVCFSFGTYRNQGSWLLKDASSRQDTEWLLLEEKSPDKPSTQPKTTVHRTSGEDITTIPRITLSSPEDFKEVLSASKPVILTGLDIGPCRELWTNEYLEQAVGRDRTVIVHEAGSDPMNFQSKNFSYVTKGFGAFLGEVSAGARQYLRSIASDKSAKTPANLALDFPGLRDDFRLPPKLSIASEQAHSSPLRISGAVNMWLHYDVLANVLCQIRGSKHLVLYPPSDVTHLQLPPGASSSTLDVFASDASTPTPIPNTHPHSAALRPGEILFIPPLWLHAAAIPTEGVSIAVNVFFRNLSKGYAEGRDVYANRDLQAYEKGRENVQRIAKSFEGVPADMARFYLERLSDELRNHVV